MSSDRSEREDIRRPFRRADLLLLLPFVWQLGLAPWANRVEWSPFGVPFMMVWQMAGIVFATLILALRFRCDRGDGDYQPDDREDQP